MSIQAIGVTNQVQNRQNNKQNVAFGTYIQTMSAEKLADRYTRSFITKATESFGALLTKELRKQFSGNAVKDAGVQIAQELAAKLGEKQGLKEGRELVKSLKGSLKALETTYGKDSKVTRTVLNEKRPLSELVQVKIVQDFDRNIAAVVEPGREMRSKLIINTDSQDKFNPIICSDTTGKGTVLEKKVQKAVADLIKAYEEELVNGYGKKPKVRTAVKKA